MSPTTPPSIAADGATLARRPLAIWLFIALSHALALGVALTLLVEPGGMAIFRADAGVILAGFLMIPRRQQPYLAAYFFAVTVLAMWLSGRGQAPGIALAVGYVVVGFIGARVYERIGAWRGPIDGLRPLCALFAGAFVIAVLSASFGMAVFSGLTGMPYWDDWLVYASASLLGVMLVTPVVMSWWSARLVRLPWPAIVESAMLFALVLALSSIVFVELLGLHDVPLIAAFVPAPFLVWAGARRSGIEVTALLLLVTLIAVWSTAHGTGPAEDIHVPILGVVGPAANRALWIQSYLVIMASTVLLMRAAMAERGGSEAAARARESILRTIIETSPDAIVSIDEKGVIESFSASAEHMFGYRAAEVIGQNISVLMPSPDRERHDAYLSRYLETGERRIIGFKRVVTGRRRSGEMFPMELAVGEAVVDGRRVFTGFVHDITRRQAAERRLAELQIELLHVSRLSDMGQLAASLAHELNQPLTAIMNYVQAMRHLLAQGTEPRHAKVEDVMEKVVAQAARAGQVIRRLRGFVAKGVVEARHEDINRLIEEANALALVGVKEQRVHTTLKLASHLPPVLVDRVQIQQVLVNLVRNAIEAMAESKTRMLAIESSIDDSGFVRVSVTDTGPGLAPDVLERLFQPFVTTKPAGMGIGLSICKSIIEAHGGRLWHEPVPADGATFIFTLPASPQS